MSFVTDLDFLILDFIRTHMHGSLLDSIMVFVTRLGNAGILWIIAAVWMMITKKYRRSGCIVLIALILGFFIGNIFLKNLIARPRPCWIRDVKLLIPIPHDYSFPSGHTLASVISAVILLDANKKLGIASSVIAVLIAFSRMYLYVHFPTDILGGVLLGILIAVFSIKIFDKIIRKLHNN